MNLSKPAKLLTALLIFLILIIVLARPLTIRIAEYLSKTEKADANLLVIEGWLPFDDLKAAADEFLSGEYEYILTTGLKATTRYYNVNTDGYLIFYIGSALTEPVTEVAVKASSELEGENSAHFNLWVNDTIIRDFTADKKRRVYSSPWNGDAVDSVMIEFDNDRMGRFGDRNLFVKEVILNGKTSIPFLNNSVYDISALDNRNRIINNMNSNSELTAKRLLSMGIDSSKVIAVPGNNVRVNRTLTSALALRDWLKTSGISVKGINIVSNGTHSRRTWLTFKRVLDNSVNVGVIALPDTRNTGVDGVGYVKTLRETIAYIYYMLILTVY